MLSSTKFLTSGLAIIIGLSFWGHGLADEDMTKKEKALADLLAKENYKIGNLVEYVPDFRVKGWKYVDPRHMTVVGAESRRYLVSLQKCYGLSFRQSYLLPKTSKADRLTRHDTFLVKNKGMTVAHCDVKDVYELNPIE